MKLILLFCIAIAASPISRAQQKQGIVTFERTAHMRLQIAENDAPEQNIPHSRTDQFLLSFAGNKSLWKQAENETQDDEPAGDQGGVQIRMIVAGSDDILFTDIEKSKRTELRVIFDKKFLVVDTVRPLKWKVSDETRTILDHVCRKATATTIIPRSMMTINNGVMERKEIADTSAITAWFTSEIPVSAGPGEYQGQLPGLILALDVNNGRQVYKAIAITDKVDIASIKEPTGKRQYSAAEFRKEREKLMDEMQKNQGGNRQIRIN